ncbi:DUF7683 domain-containing protein [Streptomyces clavifer]|uniref:DUF7683 domain-containing protein n=1 Tax=Streptomyces clavifer TaxID=68188 RepID=UPI0036579646
MTRYAVERYRKGEDLPEGDTDVTALGGRFLADLFGCPVGQFVNVYAVEPRHAEVLVTLPGLVLDLDAYDYFLSVTAEDIDVPGEAAATGQAALG